MELEAVVEIMGGQEAIGQEVRHTTDFIAISAKGMPSKVIQAIQDRGNFSNKDISSFLDISESTLQRYRKSAKTLKKDDAEKAFHLSSVLAKGISILGDEEKFNQWLNLENKAIGGIKPITWLNSSIGREEILRLLNRIEYGIYS
jgi:putative toxin-antitoxin system antitoxin component (TIGR02293 family)